MSRHAARTDANHAQMTQALRSCGWTVIDTSRVGHGFPDLLCARGGCLVLVEVKDGSKSPSKRRLTVEEAELHQALLVAGVDVVILERVEQVAQL